MEKITKEDPIFEELSNIMIISKTNCFDRGNLLEALNRFLEILEEKT